MNDLVKHIITIFGDELLINKSINIKDDINDYFYKEYKCKHYITKGKYKNTICSKSAYKQQLCKVHYKYTDEYINKDHIKDFLDENIIELSELKWNNKMILISKDNLVYEKFPNGYFPIGKYEVDTNFIKKN